MNSNLPCRYIKQHFTWKASKHCQSRLSLWINLEVIYALCWYNDTLCKLWNFVLHECKDLCLSHSSDWVVFRYRFWSYKCGTTYTCCFWRCWWDVQINFLPENRLHVGLFFKDLLWLCDYECSNMLQIK